MHTQALNAGSQTSENSRSPSPTHQTLTPPFQRVGLASNPPSSSGRCPAPPSPTRITPPRLPTPGPHSKHFHRPAGEEKRPLPSPPNGAPSPDEHTYLQLEKQSCPIPDTGGPPPVPYHRSESQTSDRRRVLPRTPSPSREDKSVRPRRSTDPGVPSTLALVETSSPVARTPNIVVDEFKDTVAAAGNDANKQNRSTTPDKPLLPKKKVQWRKEDLERRYKNIPDSCTQSEHCTQPVTINSESTDDDTQYYSVVPAEKDSGAYENSHASSAQRSSDRHVYMNTPPAHVGDRSRVYMKCMSTDNHTTEDAERLMVAANVKRSGSMPLLTDLPHPASIPYYNVPDLKAEPFYQNPNLKGQKGSRCPPPPSVAPGDSQKKPVPAPRRTASKQELHSVEYYEEHPMHPCKEEQNQNSQKKDIMSVIMDRSLEEDSLGLPKEKWEKLLLLLCFPSPLQNDWRVLASKLDLTNVDVMLLESVRENYKELPARYVFKYWQRHGPLPYTRQEVQRVLIELERLELAGMFDDYCTLPIKPVS
ncbi:Hypp5012 [Branchiostoma lanceolatum]|uniref:Hypp5012 protein n=1 Tax=Branchiostoma lanceolatum TaxID=7740 RepID=A0A8K0ACT1_BRALA|nr:Hypp5012 [Branchiostoma lanceolatum]